MLYSFGGLNESFKQVIFPPMLYIFHWIKKLPIILASQPPSSLSNVDHGFGERLQ